MPKWFLTNFVTPTKIMLDVAVDHYRKRTTRLGRLGSIPLSLFCLAIVAGTTGWLLLLLWIPGLLGLLWIWLTEPLEKKTDQ